MKSVGSISFFEPLYEMKNEFYVIHFHFSIFPKKWNLKNEPHGTCFSFYEEVKK